MNLLQAGLNQGVLDELPTTPEKSINDMIFDSVDGSSPKKTRKKASKAIPGDTVPTLTKNNVKKADTKKKAAKKASGIAK